MRKKPFIVCASHMTETPQRATVIPRRRRTARQMTPRKLALSFYLHLVCITFNLNRRGLVRQVATGSCTQIRSRVSAFLFGMAVS